MPQVHGASKDTIDYVESVLTTEINSTTDNPTVFPEEDMVVSAGNFHGQPIALAMDFLAIALAEAGNISERRTYKLISGARELPKFLVANPGLNSGFMIPQYTAASIVSQSKGLCMPASVDSIPSSQGQEDHVSMGSNAATKALARGLQHRTGAGHRACSTPRRPSSSAARRIRRPSWSECWPTIAKRFPSSTTTR